MRKLMWFGLGFGMGCALAAYWVTGVIAIPIGVVMLAAAFAVGFFGRRLQYFRITAVILIGLGCGMLWYQGYEQIHLTKAKAADQQVLPVTIEAADYSYETEYGIAVDGEVTLEGKRYKVRVYLDDVESVAPGDQLLGEFRFRYTAEGAQKNPTYHRGDGIFLLAYSSGEEQVIRSQGRSWKYFAVYLRQYLLETIDSVFPSDTAAFARALLLGDTSGFDYETDTALKISGIRHVAAVSGMHVSILFSLLYMLTMRRRLASLLISAPVLLLFAAMAGFTPSVVRACIMIFLMRLAMVLRQEYDPPTALSFSAVVILLCNPQSVTSVGFQLSVASVAGIILFYRRIWEWLGSRKWIGPLKGDSLLHKLRRWLCSSVSVSLSATVFTAPLSALYFGTVSLVSALTNLLTLWVINFVFCGIILACILGSMYLPLGMAVAWVVGWPIRFVLWIAGVLARFPLAAVYTQSVYTVIWLVLCYFLLTLFLLAKKKRPAILTCCCVLGLCISLLCSWVRPGFQMTVLDVGEGQCILLQGGGKTFLVDCGGSDDETTADLAAQTLLSRGIYQLDGVILTHYDRDHVGGLSMLLSRISAECLIVPGVAEPTQYMAEILAQFDGDILCVYEDLCFSWGEVRIQLFAPKASLSENESGLCILFQKGSYDILITGDRSTAGEARLLRQADLPDIEVLVVGHHGSASSTGTELLEAVRPETAVISVGQNSYNHPAQEVLDRLSTFGCAIYRTDIHGMIVIRG